MLQNYQTTSGENKYYIPESQIVATVTDNGSNSVKAFKEVGVDFKTPNEDSPAESHSDLSANNGEDNIEAINIKE